MQDLLISVVITTYMRPPEMLMRAVGSVLRQTHRALELIVVDDSPSDYPDRDGVMHALIEADKRLRYIRHERNMGACAARNTGLKHARGEFIAFLDDDDEWQETKLEKQLAVLIKTGAALVYCPTVYFDDATGNAKQSAIKYHRGDVFGELFALNFIGTTSNPLLRKECLLEIGGFNAELAAMQDYFVWLRVVQKYPVEFIEEPLVIYHHHAGEQISDNLERRLSGYQYIDRYFDQYLRAHPGVRSAFYRKIAMQFRERRRLKIAWSYGLGAIALMPFHIGINLYIIKRLILG